MKKNETISADAESPLMPPLERRAQPSINYKPLTINQPIDEQDFEKNSESEQATPMPHCPALEALKPILSDYRYFVRQGHKKRIAPAMAGQIQAALGEIALLLQPASPAHTQAAIQQLWRQLRKREPQADEAALFEDYLDFFAPYPADIQLACLQQIIASRPYPTLPPLADCEPLLGAPLRQRKGQQDRLHRLLSSITTHPPKEMRP